MPDGAYAPAVQANIHTGRGVAIREFPLKSGHDFTDYLLYVEGKAAGVIEAKKEGATLTGVENQPEKYTKGLPDGVAQLKVSLGRFSSIALPAPPLTVQQSVVSEVDCCLSLADEAEAQVNINLNHFEILRRSVLQRSFCPCVLA